MKHLFSVLFTDKWGITLYFTHNAVVITSNVNEDGVVLVPHLVENKSVVREIAKPSHSLKLQCCEANHHMNVFVFFSA